MARPDLPAKLIEQTVARELGGATVSLTPIAQGEDSQTFGVEADGQSYVVRINRWQDGFLKDCYAYDHFASDTLPVPRVLATGAIDAGLFFCITERAAGDTLQDKEPAEVSKLTRHLFQVWNALAECDLSGTTGCGWFDQEGRGQSESWRAHLRQEGDGWEEAAERVRGEFADPSDLLDLFRSLIESSPEERSLVHGDFGSNNIMVADGRVTAVLDWDHAMYGDPIFDVATARFWSPWLNCMEQQSQFFDERLSHLPNYEERMLCYQLFTGFHIFLEGGDYRDPEAARWAEARCREVAAGRF